MHEPIDTAAKIAEYLLNIKAIKLQPNSPFTWASGWKSPIYSDNRLTLSHPEVRDFIKKSLASNIKEKFPEVEAIIGVATAGIAPGVLAADELNLPFGYVRPEPKKHGMGKQIEGDITEGTKVVVVEDLVSTGKSSLQGIEAIRKAGVKVLGMASIFTYGFDIALENFKAANCEYFSLSNYNVLINVALKQGYIQSADLTLLNNWRNNPETWG